MAPRIEAKDNVVHHCSNESSLVASDYACLDCWGKARIGEQILLGAGEVASIRRKMTSKSEWRVSAEGLGMNDIEAKGFGGIPNDPEFVDSLSKLLGFLVINAGLFEFGIASVIATVYHGMGGKRIEPEIPIKLSRSITFLQKCGRQLLALEQHKTEIEWISQECRRLSPIRNDVLHGYISEYDESADHLLTFAKATPDKKTKSIHIGTLRRITAAELVQAGRDMHDLSLRTAKLGHRLLEPFVP